MVTDSLKFRRRAVDARDGSDVDNFTAALRDHEFSGGLRKKESARQIRFDHFVPMFKPHLLDRSAPRSASIIDENIDAPELSHRRVDNGLHVGGILHIAAEGQRLYAEALQFYGSLLATFFLACAQHKVRAHFGQAFRHLTAEADGAAGDDRNATSQVKELSNIHRNWRAFPFYLTCWAASIVVCPKHMH